MLRNKPKLNLIMLAVSIAGGVLSFCQSRISWAIPTPTQQTQEKRLSQYRQFLDKNQGALGPWGDASQHEIEIELSTDKMKEIEQKTGRTVGIILDDPFWILLNDPVKFHQGKSGVYGRLLWKKSLGGLAGVAVMAVTPNKRILLNRNYRHATRSWEYEIPRGGIEKGESAQDSAVREVKEETGYLVKDLKLLGEMANDSGMTSAVTSVYLATAGGRSDSAPEDSEAIAAVDAFSVQEINRGLQAGHIVVRVNHKDIKIPMRDPFLTYALWQAEIRGLLSKD